MKCPFTLKALRNSLLVCVLVGGVASNDACAEAIELTFFKAETMLKKHPSELTRFLFFKTLIHNTLKNFLDVNNKQTYIEHLRMLEQDISDFHKGFVINPEFKCIKGLTTALHADLIALLTLLKSHIDPLTRSATTLGLSLAGRFAHLLPKVIIKEVGGAYKLPGLLEHRLSC